MHICNRALITIITNMHWTLNLSRYCIELSYIYSFNSHNTQRVKPSYSQEGRVSVLQPRESDFITIQKQNWLSVLSDDKDSNTPDFTFIFG